MAAAQIGAGLGGGAAVVGAGQPGRSDRLPVGGSVPSPRALSGGEHEFAPDVASLTDPLGVSGAFKWIRTSYRRDQVATRGQLRQPGQIARGPVLWLLLPGG